VHHSKLKSWDVDSKSDTIYVTLRILEDE